MKESLVSYMEAGLFCVCNKNLIKIKKFVLDIGCTYTIKWYCNTLTSHNKIQGRARNMMIQGLDKEVEKFVRFWQQEKGCIILLSENGGRYTMDVMYATDGRIERGVDLGTAPTKCKLMTNIRNYFKQA